MWSFSWNLAAHTLNASVQTQIQFVSLTQKIYLVHQKLSVIDWMCAIRNASIETKQQQKKTSRKKCVHGRIQCIDAFLKLKFILFVVKDDCTLAVSFPLYRLLFTFSLNITSHRNRNFPLWQQHSKYLQP